MTMDYNKWGVVTGIISFACLLIYPLLIALSLILHNDSILFASALVGPLFLIISVIFWIATLILGVLSIIRGDKKKTALVLGFTYISLLGLMSILLFSNFSF